MDGEREVKRARKSDTYTHRERLLHNERDKDTTHGQIENR